MHETTSNGNKTLFTFSIIVAFLFALVILIDYFQVETTIIGIFYELLIIPLFLTMLVLPVIIFLALKRPNKNRKKLIYAAIISFSTIVVVIVRSVISLFLLVLLIQPLYNDYQTSH